MPNFSGVWTLKEQGVAVKGDRWQPFIDLTGRAVFGGGYSSNYENTLEFDFNEKVNFKFTHSTEVLHDIIVNEIFILSTLV